MFAVASGGVLTAHGVGGAGSGVLARAGVGAAGVDGVPHTFGIDVALCLVFVAEDALDAALGSVAGGEPVASEVGGTFGGSEVELALLAADVALGVPVAHGLSSARTGVGVEGASLLAGRLGGIPHAGGVGCAGSHVGVLSLALAVARLVVGVQDTHDILSRADSGSELVAGLLALADDGVEHAAGLSVAALLGEAGRFAASSASVGVGVEFASGIGLAGKFGGVAALAHALGSSGGVSALSVSIAGSGGGVAIGALSSASLGVAVPHAHTVAGAVTHVGGDRAAAAALVAESVPLATVVGVAGGLSGVGSDALGDASEIVGVLAEGRGVASNGGVGGAGFEREASARGCAEFSGLVPLAVLVGVAAVNSAVFDDASLDALLSGVGGVTTEASGAERAAALAESGALAVGHLRALDDALAGVPVAFVVGDAIAGGVDLGAGSLANLSLGVPLAVDGVGGARSGVVAVAVAAAESAAAGGVREDAHAGFGLAVNARTSAVAGDLAGGLFGVPHA